MSVITLRLNANTIIFLICLTFFLLSCCIILIGAIARVRIHNMNFKSGYTSSLLYGMQYATYTRERVLSLFRFHPSSSFDDIEERRDFILADGSCEHGGRDEQRDGDAAHQDELPAVAHGEIEKHDRRHDTRHQAFGKRDEVLLERGDIGDPYHVEDHHEQVGEFRRDCGSNGSVAHMMMEPGDQRDRHNDIKDGGENGGFGLFVDAIAGDEYHAVIGA